MRKLNDNSSLQDFTKVVFETTGFKIIIEVIDIKELIGASGKIYYLVRGINLLTEEKIYFYTSNVLTDIFEKEDLLDSVLSITFKGERKSKMSKFTYKIFDVFELESDEIAGAISEEREKDKP